MITEDRLIEIAEGAGPPSDAEVRELERSERLRRELERLRELFRALRSQPEPQIDAQALSRLLPAVRLEIKRRRRHNRLVALPWRPALAHALALAASLIAVLALFQTGYHPAIADGAQPTPEEIFGEDLINGSTQPTPEELQLEASAVEGLVLFPDEELAMIAQGVSGLLEDNEQFSKPFDYYTAGAEIDEAALELLEMEITPNAAEIKAIENYLKRRDL